MPYKINGNSVYVQRGNRWVLLKTHKTRQKALAHFRALQINVMKKERKGK
jgi:hypothetical protein